MKKITLAVLFGGSSTEYEISLQSAHAVLTHLDPGQVRARCLLGITRDGRWLLYQGPGGRPAGRQLGTPTPAIPSRR